MPVVRTAVTIDAPIYHAAEDLAKDLHVSRSELYTQALAAFLELRREKEIRDRINACQTLLSRFDQNEADDATTGTMSALDKILEREAETW